MSPLEAATFDEIVTEIGRRFPNAILVTFREGEAGPNQEECRFKYFGSPTFALGILSRADSWLRSAIQQNEVRSV